MEIRDALSAALGKPRLYLGTNVLLDLVRSKRPVESRELVKWGESKQWRLISSLYARMELYQRYQEEVFFLSGIRQGQSADELNRRRTDFSPAEKQLAGITVRINNDFDRRFQSIEWVYLDEDGWRQAISFASQLTLSVQDCLHLATAVITGCDVLVTRDGSFSKAASQIMASGPPDQVLREAQGELGSTR